MNLLRENLIFVFFVFCFAVCGLLALQLSRVPDYTQFSQPNLAPDAAEAARVDRVLALADRMIATTSNQDRNQPPDLSGGLKRNPYQIRKPQVVVQVEKPQLPPMHLSSISWSTTLPLAVLNGNVVAEGDTIPGSEIRVQQIKQSHVLVRYKGFQYRVEAPQGTEGGQ